MEYSSYSRASSISSNQLFNNGLPGIVRVSVILAQKKHVSNNQDLSQNFSANKTFIA